MLNRDQEQRGFLRTLRESRSAAFRSEIVPYFRYVAQSGFGLVASAIMFTLLISYVQLLRDVPATFPAGAAGTIAIALAAMRAPLRTYLRPADPVFLLAMETTVLREYIRPALKLSLTVGILRILAVYALFIPVYQRSPLTEAAASSRSVWLLGGWFAAMAAWNAYGAWRERQMVYGSRRLPLRVVRYAVTLVSTGGLLLGPLLPALAVSLLSWLIVTLCWGFPKRYALPWSKLISEEEAVRRNWNRFLGWFVDLPAEDSHPYRRRWASWIGDRLRWNRESAWRYLYAKTFTRGDTFGAFLRWYSVIGLIVAVSVNHPIMAWLAYGIGFLIGGVQLTELGGQRWTLSVNTLPIAPEGRRTAAAAVGRAAGTAATMLLWLFTAILHHPSSMLGIAPAALAAGLLWNVWLIPRRIGKSRDEELD